MQHECIPQAILGMDVLCQAKSGMGKTAVFVLSVLQQIEPATPAEVGAIVLCHTRELAYQVSVVCSHTAYEYDPTPSLLPCFVVHRTTVYLHSRK